MRWVDRRSQDGHTDEVAISVLGMSGSIKVDGIQYTWDYRRYDKHNPQAFNDPNLFANHAIQNYQDSLDNSHSGRLNIDIQREREKNEELGLNLIDVASTVIRGPLKLGTRPLAGRFFNNLSKFRGGATDPLLAGVGGSGVRLTRGEIPNQAMASIGSKGFSNRNSPIPVPRETSVTVRGSDGQAIKLTYLSNSKHTPGGAGWNPSAGKEPRNSLELFKESVSIQSNNRVRFAQDRNGNIHRFSMDRNNNWHWSGGTGDTGNPLRLDNGVKADLRRLGWRGRGRVLK